MKKNKLVITKGLPGSGKSTWAKEQVKACDWKRANKDDLRLMIDCGKWSKGNENLVVAVQELMVREFLFKGHTVVVDDTNFHIPHQKRFKAIAEEFDIPFEIKDFTDVPLEVCIERDQKRPNYVGEEVIKRMYFQYIKTPSPELIEHNPELPCCIIVDIDGTISDNTRNRGWFDGDKVYEDTPKTKVLDVIDAFCSLKFPSVFIFSGRENTGKCYAETLRWLNEKVWPHYLNFAFACKQTPIINEDKFLTLRKENDHRKDAIIKKEMFDKIVKDRYNVLAVFDDRNQVVEMWRSLGLQVFQVAPGDF